MIEELLAAFAEAGRAENDGPRPGVGAEEMADILWLAARVDPAGALRTGDPSGDASSGQQQAAPAAPPGAADAGTAPGAPADGEPAVRLYPGPLPDPARKPGDAPGGRRGSALRLPRAASLDDPLGLMRSLRPVGRRSIGGPGEELDEQLTVERSIERMVPTPVLRPAESRWLDLALVVDTHHSMLLWSDLVDELRRVLTRSGVFRDVRTWRLTGTGPGGVPMLARGRGGPPRNPLELADPAGRRLILVLSDTVAGGWRQSPLQSVLRHWCGHNAVAVLNVLPERLWTRGAVRPVPFALRADRPAAATRSWQREPVARLARPARTGSRRAATAVVPVVGIGSGSLARLVRVVSGDGRWRRLACLRLDAEPARGTGTTCATAETRATRATRETSAVVDERPLPAGDGPAPATAPAPAPAPDAATALEAVERFRASASPTAQQLAAHLAAVPLTLPVMTLVRRSLLRDSEHGHLAEVALGGLFAPWGDTERSADEIEFEFLPGVREALLGSQLRGDVAAVRELVRRRVWEFMSRHRGTGPDFSATEVTEGREQGRRHVPAGALPFAVRPQTRPLPVPRPGGGEQQEPAPEPGLRDRVVRVRYDPAPEAQEVGTLLTPRLVLTVGDGRAAAGVLAWVRSGDREVLCHPVWWDEGAPRVFLLAAEQDLVDPRTWPPEPLRWAGPDGPRPEPVQVDGRTDQGEPALVTGEMAPYGGARNGELVRLSCEPESWTHYRGGPVSRSGALVGVVHGVWPDRMVFLSGQALLQLPGFREALATHTEAAASGPAGAPVCLAVDVEAGHGADAPAAGQAVATLVRRLLRDTGTAGQVIETGAADPADAADDADEADAAHAADRTNTAPAAPAANPADRADLLVVVDAPGALARTGRILSELPGGLEELRTAEQWPGLTLAVGVSTGAVAVAADDPGFSGQAVVEAVRLVTAPEVARRTGPDRFPPLRLVLSTRLYEEVRELLRPAVRIALSPLAGGAEGWLCTRDPGELGTALSEAAGIRSLGPGWPHCGAGASANDPVGCIGIRLPGFARCLAHLEPGEEADYLGSLEPGSAVDLRGTTFENGLLQAVLDALREPDTGRVRLGRAAFDRAHFADDWNSREAEFAGSALFTHAAFAGRALFDEAVFTGRAVFDGAVFQHAADFTRTDFRGPTGMSGTVFAGSAVFSYAHWQRGLLSTGAVFEGPVAFDHAGFRGRVRFDGVRFLSDTGVELPSAGSPERWEVERRPGRVFHLRLIETETQTESEAEPEPGRESGRESGREPETEAGDGATD